MAVDEIERLGRAVEDVRAEARDHRNEVEARLAERERAYEELLRLSESLEERLQLRGVEIEQRSYLLSLSQRHYREALEQATDIIFTLDLEGRLASINAAGSRFFGHGEEVLVGRHWHQTLAPGYDRSLGEGDGMHATLDDLHETGGHEVTTVHLAAGGEVRLLATRLELIRDELGQPVSISGVARDVTELEGIQQQVRELGRELEDTRRRDRRRDREMNALLTAARVLNSELEIDQLLQHVIESAAAQIGAESGFVGLLDEGALTLRWYWRASGASWVDLEGPGVERGIAEIVLETRRPYFCADATADPNTDKEFTRRFGVRSMLVFPIFSHASELIGAMALHNFPVADGSSHPEREELALDPSDTRFLEALADVASAAIQKSALYEQVRRQAETDPLTGIFNRRAFDERYEHEIDRARRYGRPFALILVDIDHLKRVNDTYGHPIGDAAICTVADVLQNRMRRHDFAARIGGEEFAVIMAEGRTETAGNVAKSLLEAIRRRDVPRVGHITASVGVAIFPDDASSRDELFRIADEALYRAKNTGRNRMFLSRDLARDDIANPS
jgi:diguanylate cyclase (GGDEF)-like protein/PAS domain S-box-containing protein